MVALAQDMSSQPAELEEKPQESIDMTVNLASGESTTEIVPENMAWISGLRLVAIALGSVASPTTTLT